MTKMSENERQAFLARPHVGVIGIEHAGRGPLTVPIWYGYEPGGDLTILTHPESVKGRLISASGRFSLCAQSESLPYKYVMVEGPVIETRLCDVEGDVRPMAKRYLGDAGGDQYVEDGDDSGSVLITMRPEHWYSVDYAKA